MPRARADFLTLAAILAAAVVYVASAQRGDAFYGGDTSYFELARSILRGSYGFNFRPETMLPPGFPAILAVVAAMFGSSHAVMVRACAVLGTLGVGASYLLLRREAGRQFAVFVTALLLVSPTIFRTSTTTVFSDLTYFLTSMTVLLMIPWLDMAGTSQTRAVRSLLCGFFLLVSQLVRSAGITLLAGLFAWLVVSCWVDRRQAMRRCRTFVPLLLAGLVVQVGWMCWIKQNEAPPEWPIGGYPRSYTAQLSVRNGNEPELGFATAADIPIRVAENLVVRAAGLVEAVTGKGGRLPHTWFAPWVVGPVILILVGLVTSLWNTGGKVEDWYFIAHEGLYLLWPWDFEMRFILPVVPLACLYLWRGVQTISAWSIRKPKVAAGLGLLISAICGSRAIAFGWHAVGARSELAAACWLLFAVSLIFMGWTQRRQLGLVQAFSAMRAWIPEQLAAVAMLVALVAVNAKELESIGQQNLAFDVTQSATYPEILAAKWIRVHAPRDAVVMARQMDVVYHYAERKVVWFPPITDPNVLFKGIRRHHVSFIVVFDRGPETYWRPAERDCFEPLVKAHPDALRLVQQGEREQIYMVLPVELE